VVIQRLQIYPVDLVDFWWILNYGGFLVDFWWTSGGSGGHVVDCDRLLVDFWWIW